MIGSCHSFSIHQEQWMYKGIHPIGYDQARSGKANAASSSSIASSTKNNNNNKPPIVLLNGFGVGSFHQHRLMQQLVEAEQQVDRQIYGMDYLGQGRSWPKDCQDGTGENEVGLMYSGDT